MTRLFQVSAPRVTGFRHSLVACAACLVLSAFFIQLSSVGQPVYCAEYNNDPKYIEHRYRQWKNKNVVISKRIAESFIHVILMPAKLCIPDEYDKRRWNTGQGIPTGYRYRENLGAASTASRQKEIRDRLVELENQFLEYQKAITRADSAFSRYRSDVTKALNNLNDEIIADVLTATKRDQVRSLVAQAFDDQLQSELERRVIVISDSLATQFETRVQEEVERKLEEVAEEKSP